MSGRGFTAGGEQSPERFPAVLPLGFIPSVVRRESLAVPCAEGTFRGRHGWCGRARRAGRLLFLLRESYVVTSVWKRRAVCASLSTKTKGKVFITIVELDGISAEYSQCGGPSASPSWVCCGDEGVSEGLAGECHSLWRRICPHQLAIGSVLIFGLCIPRGPVLPKYERLRGGGHGVFLGVLGCTTLSMQCPAVGPSAPTVSAE